VIAAQRPDVVFLDVQMPEVDGFEVLRHLGQGSNALVVFVTAFDTYALEAFEQHAFDYLLKPFSDERFEAALDRAVRLIRAGRAESLLAEMQHLLGAGGVAARPGASRDQTRALPVDRILLKGPDRLRLLPVQQIAWIEAAGVYVKLHTRDGAVHLHRSLLGDMDEALDSRRFVRVHRSAIVNIDLIDELHADVHGDYVVVLKDRTEVRLGRRYRERLQQRLGQPL
jgi:two-component system LytT family response regulator